MEDDFQAGIQDSSLTDWGFYKLDSLDENKYNIPRAEIGLSSLADSRIKTAFMLKNCCFHIEDIAGKRINYWMDKSDYDYAISHTIFVE